MIINIYRTHGGTSHNLGEYLISDNIIHSQYTDKPRRGNYNIFIQIISIYVELDTDQVIRVKNGLLYLILGAVQFQYHNQYYKRNLYGFGGRPKRGKQQYINKNEDFI